MLAVLPKLREQWFDAHGAGNLNLFAFEPGYVADIKPLLIDSPEELQQSGQRRLVRRVRGLERGPSLDQALLEDHTGDGRHLTREFRADAKARSFGKFFHDVPHSFHIEIARQVRTQVV